MTDSQYRTHIGQRVDDRPLERALRSTRVSELMSPIVVQAHPNAEMEAVTEPLLEWNLSHFPVVDDDRRPVGVLRREALLRWQLETCGYQPSGPEAALFGIRPVAPPSTVGRTVSHVMDRSVIAVMSHSGLDLVSAILAHERTPVAMVIDTDGRVGGMVWAQQILTWLAERMGYVVPERDHSSGSR